jgi:8-oxo-dGTP pyrophosphatase MutT (NUDIX family)
MKPVKTVGIQYAALPYRLVGRQVQILLITSRGTGRWIIPKGWPMKGRKPHEAAAVEASEEAGLAGVVTDRPIGSYSYSKALKQDQIITVQVLVFPFHVEGHAEAFKEEGERTSRWFSYRQAANLVAEPSLRRIILEFGESRAGGRFARFVRQYRAWRLQRAR